MTSYNGEQVVPVFLEECRYLAVVPLTILNSAVDKLNRNEAKARVQLLLMQMKSLPQRPGRCSLSDGGEDAKHIIAAMLLNYSLYKHISGCMWINSFQIICISIFFPSEIIYVGGQPVQGNNRVT